MPNEPALVPYTPPPGTSHERDSDFVRWMLWVRQERERERILGSESSDPVSSSVVYTGPSTPSLPRWDWRSSRGSEGANRPNGTTVSTVNSENTENTENTENISDDPPGGDLDIVTLIAETGRQLALEENNTPFLNANHEDALYFAPSTPPRERNIQLVPNAPARVRGNGAQRRFQYVERFLDLDARDFSEVNQIYSRLVPPPQLERRGFSLENM